jgi:hypothetical protein
MDKGLAETRVVVIPSFWAIFFTKNLNGLERKQVKGLSPLRGNTRTLREKKGRRSLF